MSIKNSLKPVVEDLFSKNTDYKYPEQAINQAESLKSLSSDLYTDNIRFIYELIQNADDAQAKNVNLAILDNKYLIITHDGQCFDDRDLYGLCGINNGTKKKDLDKTGYKGLGFKAVFGKSNYVLIYSNEEYFRFDSSYKINWNKQQWGSENQQIWEKENDREFIYPWQINPIWTKEIEVANVIQQFLNSRKKQIHVAYIILLNNIDEIRLSIQQLKEQPYMFLFLRNISEMTFIEQSIDIISISRDFNYGLKKVYFNNKIVSQWIIKRYELDVPDRIREKLSKDCKAPEKLRTIRRAEMFFAAKYNDEGVIEKLQDKESHLFSYLPTKICEYTFPIIINANFLTNVNREQIHTDSVWNQWLFDRIGIKLFEWIKELVSNDRYGHQAYKLLPNKLNLTNNNLSTHFNDAYDRSIKNCNFIRSRQNQLLTVNEVLMDSTSMSEQASFINIDTMRQYVIDLYKTSSFRCPRHPFIDYDSNLNRIGVRRFTWRDCIEMFKSDLFLQTHSIEQNKRMIEYFYRKYSSINSNEKVDINYEEIPFLMDQNNRLQLPKDIYFPGETIGESGTVDSDDLFVNKSLFDWLNHFKQAHIKKWLTELGVDERTDLTYLEKTIIPNASTYITKENAIKTIQMLFKLFENHHIEKDKLNQLKQLKLLTTDGSLLAAEECFFSDSYDPRLKLEQHLKTKEDKFVSGDYFKTDVFACRSNHIDEWYRFFKEMGVHDDLYLIHYTKKLNINDAIQYGFSRDFLTRPSPNGRRPADGYSGLKTISFLTNTKDNFEFAQVFWSSVIEKMDSYEFKQWSTRVFWGSSYGTEITDADYIEWFVQNIRCIPTTLNNCQSSINTFINTDEIKQLCDRYMPIVNISSKQHSSKWISFFHFKTKFSLNDYFQLLEHIRNDQSNLENNQERIQNIYTKLLNDIFSYSIDEQNFIKTKSNTLYFLTENNQWKLASDLYVYIDRNDIGNHLKDIVPCIKLNLKNRNHPNLQEFTELFHIKQIKINDFKVKLQNASFATDFQEALVDILPYLKKWLLHANFSSDIISSIDKIVQQETQFIECDSLELYYKKEFVQQTEVYNDRINQKFYIKKPWDSEKTLITLPKILCQLLDIDNFQENLRFLLKAKKYEIDEYFEEKNIEIPTDQDRIQLDRIAYSDVEIESSSSSSPFISNQDEQSSTDEEEKLRIYTRTSSSEEINNNDIRIEQYVKRLSNDSSGDYNSIQSSKRRSNKRKKRRSYIENNLSNEMYNDLQLIDLSTISNSNSAPIKTSFRRNRSGNSGQIDLETGLTGEELVYLYLKNQYSSQSDSVSIEWCNENEEKHCSYDILLTINGIKHYIEVKTTRTTNQHTFYISLNQIKCLLENGPNYHIYRVYLKEKNFIILDNIETLLRDKNQLALLLTMNPKKLDPTIFTAE